MLSFAIFAHNEEFNLRNGVEAILKSGISEWDRVNILVNGSTDNTLEIAKHIASEDPRVLVHNINYGDKSNAWNHYVYKIARPDYDHIFVDGDVRIAPDCTRLICDALAEHPAALAVSALPRGGRTSEKWSQSVISNHGMPGNCYALRCSTVERIKDLKFFLPVGFVGDDTLLRWLLLRAFDPNGEINKERIQPCLAAFEYDSFEITSIRGLRALYKRHIRYSRRDMEMVLVIDVLKNGGIKSLPRYASEMYHRAKITTALDGGKSVRHVFFLHSFVFARLHKDVVPIEDPWSSVFE